MTQGVDILRQAMVDSNTSQADLSRLSGVHQPSISQLLSRRIAASDEQLDRLLSCMGYRLEVTRQAVKPDLTRSERRSWLLHRQLSSYLTSSTLDGWQSGIRRNL